MSPRRRWAAAAALALALAGCGSSAEGGDRPELTVAAAASLEPALSTLAADHRPATVRLSFAGSDELAAQIRQGVRPDVFAAANTALPERLRAEGLVERPVVFSRNRLVVAVPARGSEAIRSVADLARPGTDLAIGAPGVPVGAYTRAVLDRLPAARRDAILANVRSNEPDVGGVVGKLTQGAVDAGFVYATDVRASRGALRAIELPGALRPQVAYGVAVVRGSKRPREARAFVASLTGREGQRALRAAGFAPPPAP